MARARRATLTSASPAARGKGALFRKGKPVRSCREDELFDLLIEEVEEIVAQKQAERAVAT